jgi:chromosome segregation ATPase
MALGKGVNRIMTDRIGNEEELSLLRQENQALREQSDVLQETTRVLEETISLQREQIGLKDQLIAALQRETMLLTQQVQELQDQLKKDSYGRQMPPSSVRFARPPKSLRKKSHQKRG